MTGGLLGAGVLLTMRTAAHLAGESLFWKTQHWVARNELVVIDRWRNIDERERLNTITDAQYANAVETQVLPTWREAEHRLQQVQLPDTSPNFAKLQYLRAFVSSRRTAYELCRQGARQHNPDSFKRCKDELTRGDQMPRNR